LPESDRDEVQKHLAVLGVIVNICTHAGNINRARNLFARSFAYQLCLLANIQPLSIVLSIFFKLASAEQLIAEIRSSVQGVGYYFS
jgi:hypothetical protein